MAVLGGELEAGVTGRLGLGQVSVEVGERLRRPRDAELLHQRFVIENPRQVKS